MVGVKHFVMYALDNQTLRHVYVSNCAAMSEEQARVAITRLRLEGVESAVHYAGMGQPVTIQTFGPRKWSLKKLNKEIDYDD